MDGREQSTIYMYSRNLRCRKVFPLVSQVCIPEHCARILTYPETVTRHNIDAMRALVKKGNRTHPGAQYLCPADGRNKIRLESARVCEKAASELRLGDVVERHLSNGDIVLFNRQPSLHRLSIQAFRAVVKKNRTLRFNECCCGPFNADFDGDEMNIHLPQTEEAKAEAATLMIVSASLHSHLKNDEILPASYLFHGKVARCGKILLCEILNFSQFKKIGFFFSQRRISPLRGTGNHSSLPFKILLLVNSFCLFSILPCFY